MPLPADEKIVAPAEELLKQFEAVFGLLSGFCPVRARGALVCRTTPQEQTATIFDRVPRVDGIEPSNDPLFECSNRGLPSIR